MSLQSKWRVLCLLLLWGAVACAEEPRRLGASYFLFFDGPGLAGTGDQTPNVLGLPEDDGLFAKFAYQPSGSRWSVFSLVMPRIFFYRDRGAAEPQLLRAGYSPGLKPEFALSLSPSINYDLGRKLGLRFGTEFTYRKLVLSSWNPFDGSLNGSDIASKAWRLAPVPAQVGLTFEPDESLNVSIFFQGFPIAAQRVRKDGVRASFSETTSVGMWVSGALL